MAHAEGESGIWNALRAGVDSIEHGYSLSKRCASLMVRQGTFLVPTLTAIPRAPEELRGVPTHVRAKAAILGPRSETAFRIALETGVRIAMGTDAGTSRQGANSVELAAMVALGMSPMEAIVSATSRAAECIGVDASVGRLQPGELADLIAVDGDPLADISCLQDRARLVIVMKGGAMYRNQFAAYGEGWHNGAEEPMGIVPGS
jgi:imidazolonepropionase-like amidohydrolase